MTMYGADASALDEAAAQLEAAAAELNSASGGLGGLLGGLAWIGNIASAFVGLWNSDYKPRLGSTASFIEDAARELRRQAAQQRDASNSDGGSARAAPPAGAQTPKQQLDARFAENERRLRDYMATLDPQSGLYKALDGALAKGYKVYDFDPEHEYLTWASGNLATATNVVVTVPGTGTTMEKLTAEMGQVNGRYLSEDTATLSTLTWKSPPTFSDNLWLDSYEQSLVTGPLGGYLEHLDAMGKNIVVTGHSAGAAAVQTLFERRPDLIAHVDGVALLAPAEIHAEFPRIMGDKPVLYAIHRDDLIHLFHNDPSDLVGRGTGYLDADTNIVYRDSGRSIIDHAEVWKGSAHDQWRYAQNFHDEIVGMFPGSKDLGNGWERQQYTDADGRTHIVDVPQF